MKLRLVVPLFVLAAVPAFAQSKAEPKPEAAQPADALSEQEREMLAIAQEFAAKCTEQLEGWLAKKEITVDRLFANFYVPIAKTDPPKFNTDWDRLSDRDIQAIEEAVLAKSAAIQFAVMVDRQGYLPTHNTRFSMPLTGNHGSDLVNNRTKRIFGDRTGILAARNERPYLIQRYERDTGESMVDLSVPIFVQGKHWGAVRIGYRAISR